MTYYKFPKDIQIWSDVREGTEEGTWSREYGRLMFVPSLSYAAYIGNGATQRGLGPLTSKQSRKPLRDMSREKQ